MSSIIILHQYHFVSNPNGMNGSLPGISGVSNALTEISDDMRTEIIGYAYTDHNGDDNKELIIGNTENTYILAAYTTNKEGKAVCYINPGDSEILTDYKYYAKI